MLELVPVGYEAEVGAIIQSLSLHFLLVDRKVFKNVDRPAYIRSRGSNFHHYLSVSMESCILSLEVFDITSL